MLMHGLLNRSVAYGTFHSLQDPFPAGLPSPSKFHLMARDRSASKADRQTDRATILADSASRSLHTAERWESESGRGRGSRHLDLQEFFIGLIMTINLLSIAI